MAASSNQLIDWLNRRNVRARLTPDVVAIGLLARGLNVAEAGWVLRHVYGLHIAVAVHIAVVNKPEPIGQR